MESAEGALHTRGKLCVSRFTAGTHQFILLFKQVENLFSTYFNGSATCVINLCGSLCCGGPSK